MVYAVTIFLGSFLLFQVEPVIGKYILPWFGGGPGVWATCLVFFQVALVAGYGYAHLLGRWFKPRAQAIIHAMLLAGSLAFLPIVPGPRWKPDPFGNPSWQILMLLTATLGLPYVVLAATSPLVQEWYRRRMGTARSPYRLYALSNAGSLLALLSYPFYFEYSFTRKAQAVFWAWAMAGFAVCCVCCAWYTAQGADSASAGLPAAAKDADTEVVTVGQRVSWLGLPALASALLLATTNKLCLDLAAAPFLWVLPLALYLVSFILSFDHPRWYGRTLWSALAVAGVAGIAKLLFIDDAAPLYLQIAVYTVTMFAGCMVCHGELYRRRPPARLLTSFYLTLAVGGALGGIAVALVAPAVFHSFAELPIALWLLTAVIAGICFFRESRAMGLGLLIGSIAALFVIPLAAAPAVYTWHGFFHEARHQIGVFGGKFLWAIAAFVVAAVLCYGDWPTGWSRRWTLRMAIFAAAVCGTMGAAFCINQRLARENLVSTSRNFFGLLSVFEYFGADPDFSYYLLQNGKITHGLQFENPRKARLATTYYGHNSGVGRAIDSLPPERPHLLGLVGLGTGTLAAYVRTWDTMRIYEINQQVEALAQSRFTFVPLAPGKVQIVTGDARLSIEREIASGHQPRYDVLAVDAFSSDAIPVHLLTREAMGLYLQELAPGGILAIHISNRFFDLEPVVTSLARSYGLACVLVEDAGDDDQLTYDTSWMLVTRDPQVLERPLIAKASTPGEADRTLRLWTDDYASLLSVLR